MRYCPWIVLPLLCVSVLARAEPAVADTALATADPNAARFGLMFRGAMRAQLGAELTLLDTGLLDTASGTTLMLSPMLELHEPAGSDQVLPSQYWRARVAVALGHAWQREAQRYRGWVALEHESDHETAHEYATPGFLTQNAVTLGGDGQWDLGAVRLRVMPVLRLYVLSCTRDRARCRDFEGDTSVGAQLDATLDAPGWELASLVPFVSASALGIVDSDRVRSERHVEVHLGVWCATPALFVQAFALTYLGNEVGITRAQRVSQFGLGVSLSPR